jgi:hypothetical protein
VGSRIRDKGFVVMHNKGVLGLGDEPVVTVATHHEELGRSDDVLNVQIANITKERIQIEDLSNLH